MNHLLCMYNSLTYLSIYLKNNIICKVLYQLFSNTYVYKCKLFVSMYTHHVNILFVLWYTHDKIHNFVLIPH